MPFCPFRWKFIGMKLKNAEGNYVSFTAHSFNKLRTNPLRKWSLFVTLNKLKIHDAFLLCKLKRPHENKMEIEIYGPIGGQD